MSWTNHLESKLVCMVAYTNIQFSANKRQRVSNAVKPRLHDASWLARVKFWRCVRRRFMHVCTVRQVELGSELRLPLCDLQETPARSSPVLDSREPTCIV
jgi:hypothetical protein